MAESLSFQEVTARLIVRENIISIQHRENFTYSMRHRDAHVLMQNALDSYYRKGCWFDPVGKEFFANVWNRWQHRSCGISVLVCNWISDLESQQRLGDWKYWQHISWMDDCSPLSADKWMWNQQSDGRPWPSMGSFSQNNYFVLEYN